LSHAEGLYDAFSAITRNLRSQLHPSFVAQPLVQSTDFLLGQPESKAYHESLGVDTFIDWEGVMTDVDRFFPFVRRFLK
jgi:hypothetical protein